MDQKKLDHLLTRFYQGESSLEEEALLESYFSGDVPKAYQKDKQLFLALSSTYPEELDERLERFMKKEVAKQRNKKTFFLKSLIPYAAAVVIMAFGIHFYQEQTKAPQQELTVEEAYNHTYQALQTISCKLNKGNKEIALAMNKQTDAVQRVLNKVNLKK